MLRAITVALCAAVWIVPVGAAKPLAKPAEIEILVTPEGVSAGDEARVTLRLVPVEGVKINRYPRIRLEIDETPGRNGASSVSLGNDAPPPPDRMDTNYFDEIDPLELRLSIDPAAGAGRHDIEGRLTYFYCVTASGFCAPKRMPVTIPVNVR